MKLATALTAIADYLRAELDELREVSDLDELMRQLATLPCPDLEDVCRAVGLEAQEEERPRDWEARNQIGWLLCLRETIWRRRKTKI